MTPAHAAAREFNAPWSRTLRMISITGTALMIGVPVIVATEQGTPLWAGALVSVAMLITLLGSLLFTVRGYEIDSDALLVRRLLWSTGIPLAGLRSITLEPKLTKATVRIWGNGGLFSFSGLYWNRQLGRFRMCATDLSKAVVLRFQDRAWVVTPDRPEEFIQQLTRKAGLA